METMSKEQFFERVDEILVEQNLADQRWDAALPWAGQNRYDTRSPEPPVMHGLLVKWETGGVSGGSCWDDSRPTAYSTGNVPEELEALDAIIDDLFPEMSRRMFRQIEKLVQSGKYTQSEYYGNSTDYAFKFIPLDSVYQFLVEQNLVAAPDAACTLR